MRKINIKIAVLIIMLCAVNSLAAQFANFNKKAALPPIYSVLNFIATHPISQCAEKEMELKEIISVPSFDVNLRYNDYFPPLVYLIRKNHDFLGHFSKDYISDNVLKMLLEKGARIESYDRDGNNLIQFALETNNTYLSQYFIDNGINILHTNKYGENALNKVINSQNFAILLQVTATEEGQKMLNVDYLNQAITVGNFEIIKHIHEKGVDINVNTLTVEPHKFIANSQVYDYITQICADNAINYGDLRLFYQKFSNKFNLIKPKVNEIYLSKGYALNQAKMACISVITNRNAFDSRANIALADNGFLQLFNDFQYDPQNKINDAEFVKLAISVIDGLATLDYLIKNEITSLCTTESYMDYAESHDGFLKAIFNSWKKIFHYRCIETVNIGGIQQAFSSIKDVIAKYPKESAGFGQTKNYLETKSQYYSALMSQQKPSCVAYADRLTKESHQRYYAQKERVQKEYQAKMCKDCELDEENKKNKFPESEHYDNLLHEILFGKDKPGVMFMKNGEKYEFWQDSDFKWEIVDGVIFKDVTKFDTFVQLVEELKKRCQEKFCK
ncbi:MAG: ankyrin repeat domain-containing protein [Prevotellaceae bacterium]|jgi:hypothetical protein|nr:ankyrin repeat domain-containing protein [Prevotellaceae bacterium]